MSPAFAYLIAWTTVLVAALYGWVENLVAVIHAATSGAPFDTMLALRIIGVPLGIIGAILGYF